MTTSGPFEWQLFLELPSSAAGSLAPISAWPANKLVSAEPAPASGTSFTASSRKHSLSPNRSSLSKTSLTAGSSGCPSCGATSDKSGTPACRYSCPPLKWAHRMNVVESLSSPLLPTPTASVYGTSQNGSPHDGRTQYAGKGKMSLDTMARRGLLPGHPLGPIDPSYFEWMMNFPIGWTDVER